MVYYLIFGGVLKVWYGVGELIFYFKFFVLFYILVGVFLLFCVYLKIISMNSSCDKLKVKLLILIMVLKLVNWRV